MAQLDHSTELAQTRTVLQAGAVRLKRKWGKGRGHGPQSQLWSPAGHKRIWLSVIGHEVLCQKLHRPNMYLSSVIRPTKTSRGDRHPS